MTPRAYVLIFFFWSLLTILTPALVLLSENSKPLEAFESADGKNGGINMSRKVVGLTRKYQMLKVLAEEHNAPAAVPIPIKAPAPSPAPAPGPATAAPVRRFMAGAGKVILTTLKGLT